PLPLPLAWGAPPQRTYNRGTEHPEEGGQHHVCTIRDTDPDGRRWPWGLSLRRAPRLRGRASVLQQPLPRLSPAAANDSGCATPAGGPVRPADGSATAGVPGQAGAGAAG